MNLCYSSHNHYFFKSEKSQILCIISIRVQQAKCQPHMSVYLNGWWDCVKESTKVIRADDCHYFCHILTSFKLWGSCCKLGQLTGSEKICNLHLQVTNSISVSEHQQWHAVVCKVTGTWHGTWQAMDFDSFHMYLIEGTKASGKAQIIMCSPAKWINVATCQFYPLGLLFRPKLNWQ